MYANIANSRERDSESGYGLMVERYLAKVEIRVRFPVAALRERFDGLARFVAQKRLVRAVFAL